MKSSIPISYLWLCNKFFLAQTAHMILSDLWIKCVP